MFGITIERKERGFDIQIAQATLDMTPVYNLRFGAGWVDYGVAMLSRLELDGGRVITMVVHPGDDIFYLDVLYDAGGSTETMPLVTADECEARRIAFEIVKNFGGHFDGNVRFMRPVGIA